MILQALTRLYEDLAERGEISRPGWSAAKISFALCLNEDGSLAQVIAQQVETLVGKKTVMRPQNMSLPAAVTRTVGILPNFLWDNSSYLLGIDDKGKPERSLRCFEASSALHRQLLQDVNTPTARAIVAFFDTWQPQSAKDHPALAECMEEIISSANLVFRVNGVYAQNDPEIRKAWEKHYSENEGETAQCLVTGRTDVPEIVHPSIKGVAGAQACGAAIVSFNAPAFCSYGKEQSLNAPVGKYAAFAYTSALNHLIADKRNVHRIGDTTVLCWAEGAEPEYNALSNCLLFGDPAPEAISTDNLRAIVDKLANALPCEELKLDTSRRFYILGLAPNAARLSVRFFYNSSFGELMKNVSEHHKRLQIVGNSYDIMPLWALLKETVNLNTTDKAPSPVVAGATARAIFSGAIYPAALLEATMLRTRAERKITPGRAAIIKAYYLKNPNPLCPKEVLTVSLNESSTNIPYNLGRLFAVYEAAQEAANPGINATIKDKYFNSAASTPATVFPTLNNLYQKHLRKLNTGLAITYDRQIGQIKQLLPEEYPARMSLPEQGSFDLGYYHQKQARYTKKEDK